MINVLDTLYDFDNGCDKIFFINYNNINNYQLCHNDNDSNMLVIILPTPIFPRD